jgi:probable O-glycosylation ligase (exosortase A-associated)
MRDYLIVGLVLASLPLILRKPFFGILTWTWLALMNPHRLCWGLANTMPLSMMVAVAILVSLLLSTRESKRIPWLPLTRLLAAWWLWMFVTTLFALESAGAWGQWDKVWRIMLLTFVTIMLLTNRERLESLVWAMVVSLGFYGVKGGYFTLMTGGAQRVWGPDGTFIGGNNEIGLALIMTVPLMRYLQLTSRSIAVKNGMLGAMALTVMAILGTQSRGALVGLAAMVTYLIIKSRQRARLIMLLAAFLPAAYIFMPQSYYDRMDTIENYKEDASAMGRINAWWTAWNIALDRPLVGGGFETFSVMAYAKYAPDPANVHDVHSIYFESLGEHGFIGFALFLGILFGGLVSLGRVARFARRRQGLTWMRDMATLTQVSIIGYAVSGLFLGMAYFDFYYALIALAIALTRLKQEYEINAPSLKPGTDKDQIRGGRAAPQVGEKKKLWQAARAWYEKL